MLDGGWWNVVSSKHLGARGKQPCNQYHVIYFCYERWVTNRPKRNLIRPGFEPMASTTAPAEVTPNKKAGLAPRFFNLEILPPPFIHLVIQTSYFDQGGGNLSYPRG